MSTITPQDSFRCNSNAFCAEVDGDVLALFVQLVDPGLAGGA